MNRNGKYGTIGMAIKPTAEQKKKLRSFINAVGGNVDIDFMDESYNTTHSVSYEGVSPARALSGITTFYDKGIKPKGNESFSLSRDEIVSTAESEGTVSYSLVKDEAKIAELEASPKRIGYRNMVLNEDGTLSAPMASSLSYPSRKKDTEIKMSVSELGKWEQADEHPELVNERGKVTIYQPENGAGTTVNYDPYIHSRQDRVNTQLKGAWRRPNLVYVEVEIPITDLESGYQADKAALPVGAHEWAGGSGIVMLSMYDKPVRIADWNDVADDWMKRFGNEPIHFDIIPPQLLPILAERGANISSPHTGLGVDVYKAYDKFKEEQGVSYSISKDNAEFDAVRDLAVAEKGIVMPNLAEKDVKVVRYEDSDKRIPKGLDDEEIRKWAHENVATEDSEIIDSNGAVYKCPITRQSINEIMHRETIKNSVSTRVHILALPLLPKILSNSIEVEIHPDYNKVKEERKPEYGYNPSLLMHRFYGAVEIEGVVYRTKTIVKEYRDKNTALKPYAYEVTKIELLPYSTTDATNAHSRLLNIDNNSISATKLLQNVEKSYDLGKKVLEESVKNAQSHSLNRTDIDYLDAVNRGDMATAQKMVDEVARRAGYTIKAYHGTPNKVYNPDWKDAVTEIASILFPNMGEINLDAEYGTEEYKTSWNIANEIRWYYRDYRAKLPKALQRRFERGIDVPFTVFDKEKRGSSTGARDAFNGFFFSPNPLFASSFRNTFVRDTLTGALIRTSVGDGVLYDVYIKPENLLDLRNLPAARSKAKQMGDTEGYDVVINKVKDERNKGKVEEEIMVKNLNLIKSADAITYDNKGNIIPLSERFNQEKDDIRYSISRDEMTVATPEMVAEANETLTEEPTLVEQLDEAQTALDRLRSKIDKRNERKEMTRMVEVRRIFIITFNFIKLTFYCLTRVINQKIIRIFTELNGFCPK